MSEVEALAWVIQAAAHKALTHEQATEVAAAVLEAGWVFRPDVTPVTAEPSP